jgi:putative RNA 2'-phosphotransferase
MKSHIKDVIKTGKYLAYVLGRQPDKFGLIPNEQGFVPVKELLKALHEESGWRHVRLAHLNEVMLSTSPAPIEIDGNFVRAADRTKLPALTPTDTLPKLLYIAVRKRAYAVVAEKGLKAASRPYLILSSDRAMAMRLGRRRDNDPVLLCIQVSRTQKKGVDYNQYGKCLFLADFIPAGTFSGPALPKQKSVAPKAVAPDNQQAMPTEKTPGSYYVDLKFPVDPKATARKRRQKEKDRQKSRRYARRRKADRHS